jgi:uncharacterized protein YhaN
MKRLTISAVRDLTFGRHAGRTFDGLDADFVVVHGANESGKSTLAEFLTWAIGGPWRAFGNNTEAFRGGGDGKLGGRLLGALDTDAIDLQANFELLNAGTPRDKRTGFVGSTQVDGGSFQKFVGGITPADFELMYRCYGASLGDIGSGGSFEKLFADFAMGGTTGVRNPREALEGLRKATNSAEAAVKDAQKKINEIEKEIKEARSNPDLVEKLSNERDEIQRRLSVLDSELVEVERRRSLLTRVINGSEHRSNLDRARDSLAEQSVTSPEWLAVIENAAEITDLAERIGSESRNVERAEVDFTATVAAAGMDSSHFDGVTLSAPERLEITTATSALVKVRNDVADLRTELADLDEQRETATTAATNLARTIGLDDAKLARLDLIESQLTDIGNRAGRWSEDTNKAIDAEGSWAGEVKRREDSGNASATQVASREPDPKLLALAVLVVAGVSVVHWGAALAAAVALAAFFVLGRSKSSSTERVPTLGDGDLAIWKGRSEEARRTANEHRRLLDEGLGILAVHVTSVDLAQKQIAQLGELASRRRVARGLDDRAVALARRLTELQPEVTSAERAAMALLTPRGISLGLVNSEFEKWLTKYEAAVTANTRLLSARTALTNLQRRLGGLTASVASDVAGLTPQALAKRVEETKAAAAKRRAAENIVREAYAQIRGANLDSPEALQLLREHPDAADLNVQLENVELRAKAIRVERDDSNARIGEIRGEIERLEGTEVLPDLLFEKGKLEDAQQEATTRRDALATAHQLLGAAIDEHERENQDPVVARASELVAEIVPGWGTVIKTRVKDKLVIQRVDADGRLGDHAISDGGRALLYLAVRLAFAQQDASRRQIALPIICDDPLVHFDDARQQAAVQLLKKVSAQHQVVLFTCEGDTRDHAASLGARVIEM